MKTGVFCIVFAVLLAATIQAQPRPNIVFILADDMGYGDPRCFNPQSKIPTPNIDRLAAEGMRFTDAHAPAAVCVPSRYGLLTGRYPMRLTRNFATESLIEPGRLTIASLLKQAGYATGMVGKWHQSFDGGGRGGFDYSKPFRGGPVDRGFDSFFGLHASLDIPPYFFIQNDRAVQPASEKSGDHNSPGWSPIQGAFWRGGAISPDFKHEEVLPTITAKAVEFLNVRKGAPQPFFLYVALPAPHTPWLPAEKFRGKSGASMYGDYTMEVDDAVGQVMAALEQSGRGGDTLVFFTSDNGPVWYEQDSQKYGHRSAGPWRGMKGDAWEGGHHMPFIARWNGKIAAGSSSEQVICFTDMMATFAAVTGQSLPDSAGEDSFDISPAMLGRKMDHPVREAIVHESSRGVIAIRRGQWKLIPHLGSGGFSQPANVKPKNGDPAGQLYELATDPGEQKNLYADRPEIVKELTELLAAYKRDGHTRPAGH